MPAEALNTTHNRSAKTPIALQRGPGSGVAGEAAAATPRWRRKGRRGRLGRERTACCCHRTGRSRGGWTVHHWPSCRCQHGLDVYAHTAASPNIGKRGADREVACGGDSVAVAAARPETVHLLCIANTATGPSTLPLPPSDAARQAASRRKSSFARQGQNGGYQAITPRLL